MLDFRVSSADLKLYAGVPGILDAALPIGPTV
jgi:hypothetical protein